jgi:hypothetical protein
MKKIFITFLFILLLSSANVIAQGTPSDEVDPLRERVKAKLEEAMNNPKAYLGLITDKTETSLQIKSMQGEIMQIAIEKETISYAKTNGASEVIGYEDVAIGDYIIALGFVSPNDVLEARRIIQIPNEPIPVKRIAAMGVVEKNDKDRFIFYHTNNQKSYEVEPLKNALLTSHDNVKVPNVLSIKEGQKVIIMGILSEDIITARRIHLLP